MRAIFTENQDGQHINGIKFRMIFAIKMDAVSTRIGEP
jgi:hypothetical protein